MPQRQTKLVRQSHRDKNRSRKIETGTQTETGADREIQLKR